jgi:hypothetical protein
MRMAAGRTTIRLSAVLLLAATAVAAQAQTPAQTEPPAAHGPGPGGPPANTLKEVFEKFGGCGKPPPAAAASPMDLTVRFSFNRSGEIMGKPKITYESATATDNDRLAYRIAVMEALQRCSPMPFTETMAGAIAGHPFVIHFFGPEKRA